MGIKADAFGYEVEIPDGWEQVRGGTIEKGDRAASIGSDGFTGWVEPPAIDVGVVPARDYHCAIRKQPRVPIRSREQAIAKAREAVGVIYDLGNDVTTMLGDDAERQFWLCLLEELTKLPPVHKLRADQELEYLRGTGQLGMTPREIERLRREMEDLDAP